MMIHSRHRGLTFLRALPAVSVGVIQLALIREAFWLCKKKREKLISLTPDTVLSLYLLLRDNEETSRGKAKANG